MASLPAKLQEVLTSLSKKFSGRSEDAYRERDAADAGGRRDAANYAAGQAHAHSQDEGSVRSAMDAADK